MIHYGEQSRLVLAELSHDLRLMLLDYGDLAPPELDIVLIDGWRSGAEQTAAKARGASTLDAGKSKHNGFPSKAFDFNVWPALPKNATAIRIAAEYGKRVGFMLALAARRDVKLRCGIDWTKPYDPYHVELA